MIGGLDAIPQPARPDLNDRTLVIRFGTGDDLGVGDVTPIKEHPIANGASLADPGRGRCPECAR